MGTFFLEPVYQEFMEKEFLRCGILFVAQQKLNLMYKSKKATQIYKPDLICYGQIIAELKAVKDIAQIH